jgi:cytochrome c heme-lyase
MNKSAAGKEGGDAKSGGGCPVMHDKAKSSSSADSSGGGGGWFGWGSKKAAPETTSTATNTSACPVMNKSAPANGSACPVMNKGAINPVNNMPLEPQQGMHHGQSEVLSTERVQSTILNGKDGEEKWVYPSTQMFYNALKVRCARPHCPHTLPSLPQRVPSADVCVSALTTPHHSADVTTYAPARLQRKGKLDDSKEEDMDVVVSIHNNMNENSWNKLLEWEEMHCDSCTERRSLLKFLGRPHDLTPKARLKTLFG